MRRKSDEEEGATRRERRGGRSDEEEGATRRKERRVRRKERGGESSCEEEGATRRMKKKRKQVTIEDASLTLSVLFNLS